MQLLQLSGPLHYALLVIIQLSGPTFMQLALVVWSLLTCKSSYLILVFLLSSHLVLISLTLSSYMVLFYFPLFTLVIWSFPYYSLPTYRFHTMLCWSVLAFPCSLYLNCLLVAILGCLRVHSKYSPGISCGQTPTKTTKKTRTTSSTKTRIKSRCPRQLPVAWFGAAAFLFASAVSFGLYFIYDTMM